MQLNFVNQESRRSGVREAGVSSYEGIIVFWDSDIDVRVIQFIERLPSGVKEQLVAIHEREARLWLWWKDEVPATYEEGQCHDFAGDMWRVERSQTSDAVDVPIRPIRHALN
jgi:hypothetical protein